jgi:hypothetical protein
MHTLAIGAGTWLTCTCSTAARLIRAIRAGTGFAWAAGFTCCWLFQTKPQSCVPESSSFSACCDENENVLSSEGTQTNPMKKDGDAKQRTQKTVRFALEETRDKKGFQGKGKLLSQG